MLEEEWESKTRFFNSNLGYVGWGFYRDGSRDRHTEP